MTYVRDPYDTDQPPCFCDQEAGPVLTTEEFCPAHGDPDKPAPEPPADLPPYPGDRHFPGCHPEDAQGEQESGHQPQETENCWHCGTLTPRGCNCAECWDGSDYIPPSAAYHCQTCGRWWAWMTGLNITEITFGGACPPGVLRAQGRPCLPGHRARRKGAARRGPMSKIAYRVVDRENQGWHPTGGHGVTIYAADYGFMRDLEDRSLADLEATRGPLRPVEPVTDDDTAALRDLFTTAGRKTVATVAAALETVFHELRESRGGLGAAHDSYEYAERTLKAGREGSWESGLLIEIVLWGNELNLTKETRSLWQVDARRAAGPSKRVDAGARDVMAGMFLRWVSDPERFTEVAETLAFVVSRYCDDQEAGWKAVADQWLQPGGLAQETFSMCYRLFYSLSEHFDTGLI